MQIDDSELALCFLETRLKSWGLQIDRAAASATAIELLVRRNYDYVFLDVELGAWPNSCAPARPARAPDRLRARYSSVDLGRWGRARHGEGVEGAECQGEVADLGVEAVSAFRARGEPEEKR